MKKFKNLSTRLIHAGEPNPPINGAVSMPVFQSSTYLYAGEARYDDVRYIRLNNTPNHHALHKKLAAIENAEAALVTSSGMSAISAALLAVLSSGEHILLQDTLYGGTHTFVTQEFQRFGIQYDFINGVDPESWKDLLRPKTRAIYVEAMSNPLLGVSDLEAAAKFAGEHGLVSMIDNTFASPVNFRPADWGFDISLHSATKYLNGHTDIVAGVVIGKAALVEHITHNLNHLGGALDPHACFLLHRGMKTLELRVQYQNQSALRLAQFLERHPRISRVNYPGLESHPNHGLARKFFDGYSGMMSFELDGDLAAVTAMLEKLEIPMIAPSLGGVETLVTLPSTTSHAGMSAEERQKIGITDGLVRVSIGIEDTNELIEDFEQAIGS